jgi:hypothetical protein
MVEDIVGRALRADKWRVKRALLLWRIISAIGRPLMQIR